MEANVVTLNTAKKLKAAGFPQEIYIAAWIVWPTQTTPVLWSADDINDKHFPKTELVATAPTAQEIADQLPPGIQLYLNGALKIDAEWLGGDLSYRVENADTMAEALASLYIKLDYPNQPDQEEI